MYSLFCVSQTAHINARLVHLFCPKIKRLAREEEQSKAGIDLEHHIKAIVLRDLTERATGLFVG
jgi:hypothetical protein